MKAVKPFLFNKKAAPHFVRLLLCSLLYSMACTLVQLFAAGSSPLLLLLNLVWALFLYFVINLKWPASLRQTGYVLAYQALWLVVYYLLVSPLYGVSSLACQLVSGLLLILWGPSMLAWMQAAAADLPLKSQIRDYGRRLKNAGLFNRCCAVVLIIALLDTLTGGMYTLNTAVPAFRLLSVALFQGDPMVVPVAWGLMGLYVPAVLSLVMSMIQGWLESCVIAYGTERP